MKLMGYTFVDYIKEGINIPEFNGVQLSQLRIAMKQASVLSVMISSHKFAQTMVVQIAHITYIYLAPIKHIIFQYNK